MGLYSLGHDGSVLISDYNFKPGSTLHLIFGPSGTKAIQYFLSSSVVINNLIHVWQGGRTFYRTLKLASDTHKYLWKTPDMRVVYDDEVQRTTLEARLIAAQTLLQETTDIPLVTSLGPNNESYSLQLQGAATTVIRSVPDADILRVWTTKVMVITLSQVSMVPSISVHNISPGTLNFGARNTPEARPWSNSEKWVLLLYDHLRYMARPFDPPREWGYDISGGDKTRDLTATRAADVKWTIGGQAFVARQFSSLSFQPTTDALKALNTEMTRLRVVCIVSF
jgi:hypothetical protein